GGHRGRIGLGSGRHGGGFLGHDRGHGQGGGDTEDARELHGLLRNARKFSGKSGGAACARKARIIPSPAGKGQLKRTATGSGLVRAAASGHAGALAGPAPACPSLLPARVKAPSRPCPTPWPAPST